MDFGSFDLWLHNHIAEPWAALGNFAEAVVDRLVVLNYITKVATWPTGNGWYRPEQFVQCAALELLLSESYNRKPFTRVQINTQHQLLLQQLTAVLVQPF